MHSLLTKALLALLPFKPSRKASLLFLAAGFVLPRIAGRAARFTGSKHPDLTRLLQKIQGFQRNG